MDNPTTSKDPFAHTEQNPGPRYPYKTLEAANAIRLFSLHPGSPNSPLKGELQQTTLTAYPSYEALSYEWGKDTNTRTILIDDHLVEVRENLWSALWHIREHDRLHNALNSRTFWIDAVCVNQNDVGERSHQVSLMSRIYRQASTVVAWLGPEADESHIALKVLQSFEDTERNVNLPTTESEISAILNLFNRSYFERMWIIQEISLAERMTIHCGLLSADFDEVQQLYDYLAHISLGTEDSHDSDEDRVEDHEVTLPHADEALLKRYKEQFDKTLMAKFFTHPFARFGASVNMGLLHLLIRFQSSQCSDPRDRVFALTSVADNIKDSTIVADYSKSVDIVYQDVMRFAIDKSRLADPVTFSQMLQQSLRAHRDMENGDREDLDEDEETRSKASMPSDSPVLPRPWIRCSAWGGGRVTRLGPSFKKCNLWDEFKFLSADMAEIEDIEPIAGLPKAMLPNDYRYDLAVEHSKGVISLNPMYLDVSDASDRSTEPATKSSFIQNFLIDTGETCLGPMNVREGDIVRQIAKDTSMAVVLRKDALGLLTIVGRAVILIVSIARDASWGWDVETGQPVANTFPDEFSEKEITVFLDLRTLQRWTRWNGELKEY